MNQREYRQNPNPESFWHFISRFSFHIASGVSILLWASIIVAMLSVMKP